jgi:hypothetical protein
MGLVFSLNVGVPVIFTHSENFTLISTIAHHPYVQFAVFDVTLVVVGVVVSTVKFGKLLRDHVFHNLSKA